MSTTSSTPRTDASLYDPIEYYDMGGSGLGQMKLNKDGDWVPADFARQLETELADERAQVERLRKALAVALDGRSIIHVDVETVLRAALSGTTTEPTP